MKKFMVLYMANAADFERMMKESTPEQQKKGMEGWMKWMGDHKAASSMAGRRWGRPSGLTPKARLTPRTGSVAIQSCKPKLKKPRQSCSARIIRISRCPAAGSKSSKSCMFPGCEKGGFRRALSQRAG